VRDIVKRHGKYEIYFFIEGIDKQKCKFNKSGIPVIWINDIKEKDKDINCIGAIGSPGRKNIIEQVLNSGFMFTTLIDPNAIVFPTTSISEGTIVGAGAVIASNTFIGQHVIINRGCLIGHHVKIGNYVTISPGANIAGKAIIEEQSYIGMGAIILDGIQVGSNSVIAAGSVVTKDVPSNVQVMGVPARITKIFK
jgi:sugar O-acyltransferase (sialic acid O-acetyltransferase NeuD family)